MRAYNQRVAGYCLSGSVAEEKLFFAHGPEGSGKSTELGAWRRTWGDYATLYPWFIHLYPASL